MDIEQFKNELSAQDFGNDMDDVEALVTKYNPCLSNLLDKFTPVKRRTITVKPKRPWYNSILQEARAKTRQFERKWIKTALQTDYVEYIESMDKYARLLTSAKTEYYNSVITESKPQPLHYQFTLLQRNCLMISVTILFPK